MSFNRGSDWKKWDLHVHTPASFFWDDGKKLFEMDSTEKDIAIKKFIQVVNESDISVFCIMDYWTFDWYVELQKYLMRNPEELQKTIFPGMELRIESPTNYRLNIHVILSDTLTEQELQDFKSELIIRSINRKLSIESLKEFAKTLDESKARIHGYDNPAILPNEKLVELGSKTAEITKESLQNAFAQIPDKKGFILMPYDTSDGLLKLKWKDHPHDDNYFMQSSHIFETRDQRNIDLFSGIKTDENKDFFDNFQKTLDNKIKPCVAGSDAHKYSDYGNFPSNKATWIKANATFEGLKQIIYEPNNRVAIKENKPQEPLHKLEQIELKFDNDTNWGNEKFCFGGFGEPIVFSHYLTCIIGGRGSGKSTLLNLIAEKIGKQDTNFFSELNLDDVSSKIIFQPEVVENIEFLAQNTIESFAVDSQKFTNAIYERLNKKSDEELVQIENEIVDELILFDNQVSLFRSRKELHERLYQKKQELKKYESIIKTFTDKTYLDNKQELQILQKQIIGLEESRKKYEDLFLKLKELKESYSKIVDPKNNYEKYYNDLYGDLHNKYQKYATKDYSKDKQALKDLKKDRDEYSRRIEVYLREKGMSEENIKDAQSASTNIENIQNYIQKIKNEITEVKNKRSKHSTSGIDTKIINFTDRINSELDTINSKFEDIAKRNSQEVKPIRVEYELNNQIFEQVFDEFVQVLGLEEAIKSSRKAFGDYLNSVETSEVLNIRNGKEFIAKIDEKPTQAYRSLVDIFSENLNFQIYKLIIEKHLRNIQNHKVLKVFYDDKPLDKSSFGQRCTAAIVILLSLGNNPIIIDEPEAHLDSSLIANYLVELVKEQKQQRQIIFATHNANFVLNADAELIIKLENYNGQTTTMSFSIEDLKYRDDLLKLEGGREAFKKREQKYNLDGR